MSLLGTLFRPKSLQTPSTIATVSRRTRTCSGTRRPSEYGGGRPSDGDDISGGMRIGRPRVGRSVEDVFIQSLVIAGTCKGCSLGTTSTVEKGRARVSPDVGNVRRSSPIAAKRTMSTSSRSAQSAPALQPAEEPVISRQEYDDLVETYDSSLLRKTERAVKAEHQRLAPRLVITPEEEARPPHTKRQILEPIDVEHRQKLRRLKKLLENGPGFNARKIWRAYFDLPAPRPRYISDPIMSKLFRHFAWVETRDLESSRRYFSLLDDALSEGSRVRASDWNAAISFAGRWVQKVTAEDVKAAIDTWLRMEREGGVAANAVTFNILFDIAVKAERYALADTIYAEMDRRGLELNRYFRTSKIYYAGRRGDGESVRAAFRELVAAGEIVDTAVMNCVIVSLVHAGEPASAEHIMAKMKQLHEQKFGTASLQDWREKKAMGQQLDRSARDLREAKDQHLSSFFGSPYSNEDQKEEIQRAAPIAPDVFTYHIIIRYHAYVSGNLERIRDYITEIQSAGWRVRYTVYYHLFVGFVKHGGYAYTAWNRRSLEQYWEDFINAIVGEAATIELAARIDARAKKVAAAERHDITPLELADALHAPETETSEDDEADEAEDADPLPSHLAHTEFRAGMVMAALDAFYKCAGAKRMLEVWDEVQVKWQYMGEADRRRIEDVVAKKVREAGMYNDR